MEVCFQTREALLRASPAIIAAADEAATLWLDARDGACAPFASYEACRALWADDNQPMQKRVAAEAIMEAARMLPLEKAKTAALFALSKACALPEDGDGYDRGSGFGMNSED